MLVIIMNAIRHIECINDSIKMTIKDNYELNIPVKNEYTKNLINKALASNKFIEKDIKFYNRCANISLFPVWLSAILLLTGISLNFIAMDLVLICCGGMTAVSLMTNGVLKLVTTKLRQKANNNPYWTELYNYALNSIKNNNDSKVKTNEINEVSKNKQEIVQKTSVNNSVYHFTRNEIIQDEVEHAKKR